MQVFRTVPARAASPTVLAVGNFDGLHLGHCALLERLTAKARQLNLPASVLTFEPHPREVFAPEQAPARLTSLREKLRLLETRGIARVYVLHFSRKLAALTAEEFIDKVLVRGLAVRYLLVGDDFRFGCDRVGNFALLRKAGDEHDFSVAAMPTVDMDGERVSSSAVRTALAAGDLEGAARLLGRPYNISGRVVHGNRLGTRIGYPTANIQLKRKRVPLTGVFTATVSGLDGTPLPGAASLGVRPTVGSELKPVLEVHLLDFDRRIYGRHVTVHFLHKLRDEEKFATLDALAAQITRDAAATRAYFSGKYHG
jgi:riboflavin kinase/FMN adenylyltransferase